MTYKEICVDLSASDKGERKKVVKYLRSQGYEVKKRKDEFGYPSLSRNLSWFPPTERFEYGISSSPIDYTILTLPRDWDKLVEMAKREEDTPEEIKIAKEPKWKFPCYGGSSESERVVYFTAHKIGVIILPNEFDSIGEESSHWCMENFTPVTLEWKPIK